MKGHLTVLFGAAGTAGTLALNHINQWIAVLCGMLTASILFVNLILKLRSLKRDKVELIAIERKLCRECLSGRPPDKCPLDPDERPSNCPLKEFDPTLSKALGKWFWPWLLLACWPAFGSTNVITFKLSDFLQNPLPGRRMTVTPISVPNTNGAYIVIGDQRVYTNDATATVTLTNVLPGFYRINFEGALANSVTIGVPDSNAVWNASELVTPLITSGSPLAAYSQAAANALFVLRNNGFATNFTASNVVLLGTYSGPAGGGSASNAIDNLNGKGTNLTAWPLNANTHALDVHGLSGQDTEILRVLDWQGTMLFGVTDGGALIGNGFTLTNLVADYLASGTVPLARLSGITSNQLASGTITSNQIALATITTNLMSKEAHEAYVSVGVSTNEWATNIALTVYVATNGNDTWPGTMLFPYQSLGRAVSNSPNGSKIILRPGDYPLYGSRHQNPLGDGYANVNLINRTNLWIDGGDSARLTHTNMRSGIKIHGCSNIWLTGFGIVNDKAELLSDPEWLGASNALVAQGVFGMINVSDSSRIQLRRVNMFGSYDHGLLVDPNGTVTFETTNDCAIVDCSAENMGSYVGWWDGSGFVPGAGWRIQNCRTINAQACVEVYPVGTAAELPATIVIGCEAVNCRVAGYAAARCPVVFVGNNAWCGDMSGYPFIAQTHKAGFSILGGNRTLLLGNTVENYPYGVYLWNGNTNATIIGNSINKCTDAVLIEVSQPSRGLHFQGNLYRACPRYAVYLYGDITDVSFRDERWIDCGTNDQFTAAIRILDWPTGSHVTNLTFANCSIRNEIKRAYGLGIDAGATATKVRLIENSWDYTTGLHNLSAGTVIDYRGIGGETATNSATELIASGGITLGGVRNTTWPAGGSGHSLWMEGTNLVNAPTNINFIAGTNALLEATTNGSGAATVKINVSAPGGGEVNTASTLGTNGLYRVKVASDLRFASISGTNGLAVRTNADYVELDPSPVTNGLATVAYAQSTTNGLAALSYTIGANATNYTDSLTNQPVLVSSNITQSATNDAYAYARSVTNNAPVTNWINFRQLATANLTNWSSLATSWVTDVGVTLTNTAQVTNWINFRQPATDNLTNWSSLATSWVTTVANAYTNNAPVTNWTVKRQPASTILTNLDGTGAVTNLFSAGNTNTTRFAVVAAGTNTSGGVKTISAGANVTITEEGTTNVVLAASGGSASTNFNTLSAISIQVSNSLTASNITVGWLVVTNSQTNSSLTVSNLILDGVNPGVAYFAVADTNLTNLAQGTGMLTNNGSGTLGWMAIPSGGSGSTQMVTFAAGTGTITNALTIFGNLIVGTNLTVSNAFNVPTVNANSMNVTNDLNLSGGITLTNSGGSNYIAFRGSNVNGGVILTSSRTNVMTNYIMLSFGVPAVGEVLKVHSVEGQTAIVTNGADVGGSSDPGGTNARQWGTLNLTNWSGLDTSWVSSVVQQATNSASVTNWINFRQPATDNLTNWSSLATSWVSSVVAQATNNAPVTNWIVTRQLASTSLSNLSAIALSTGDLIRKDANNLTNLAIGAAGTYLASMDGLPVWSNGPSGGGASATNRYLLAPNAPLNDLPNANNLTVTNGLALYTNGSALVISNSAGVNTNADTAFALNLAVAANLTVGIDTFLKGIAYVSNSIFATNIDAHTSPLRFIAASNYVTGATFVTNNLTVQSNLTLVTGQFAGNGSGVTNLGVANNVAFQPADADLTNFSVLPPIYTNAELLVSTISDGVSRWTNFARGADGQVLKVSGTNLSWSTDLQGGGDAGGTNARQWGSGVLTNLDLAGITNWIGAGTVTLTTNAGAITFTGSGGGGLTTNANQFGASVELTIKSGALLTNPVAPKDLFASNAMVTFATVTNDLVVRSNATVMGNLSITGNNPGTAATNVFGVDGSDGWIKTDGSGGTLNLQPMGGTVKVWGALDVSNAMSVGTLNVNSMNLTQAFVLPGLSNVLWITPTGDDGSAGTALRGRMDRPYSLSNGVANLQNGDTALIMAGNYTNFATDSWEANVRGVLNLSGKNGITLLGIGQVNMYFPTGRTDLALYQCYDITVDNLGFFGRKTDADYLGVSNVVETLGYIPKGILVNQVTNCTFRDLRFKDLWGWGIQEDDLYFSWPCTNGNRIERCVADNCGVSTTARPAVGGGFRTSGGWRITDNRVKNSMFGASIQKVAWVSGGTNDPMIVYDRNEFIDCNDYSIYGDASPMIAGFIARGNIFRRATNWSTFSLPYMRTNLNPNHIKVGLYNDTVVELNRFYGSYVCWNQSLSGYSFQTNILIRLNTFEDTWQHAIVFDNIALCIVNTRIVNNTFARLGRYAGLWNGTNIDVDFRENSIWHWDLQNFGDAAISFKFCPFASNITIEANILKGVQSVTTWGIDLGQNTWNVQLGFNPTYDVRTNVVTSNAPGVRLTQSSYVDDTNALDTYDNIQFITPSRMTNSYWFTNVLAGTNWIRSALSNWISGVAGWKYKLFMPPITASNLVLSFSTNSYECDGLTNIVLTNIVEEVHGGFKGDLSIFVRNTNGVNCALVWPAYGAQHGYFFRTNINNPVLQWAAVTNGKSAMISMSCFGTNIFATITEWP